LLFFPQWAAASAGLTTVGNFNSPVYVTAPPGDPHRVFVVERSGHVRVVKDGTVLPTPFLDISGTVTVPGGGGLLSIAFAPNYSRTGKFYAYYTDSVGIRVAEFRASKPDLAKPSSRRILLTQPHSAARDHYGGQLQFGPDGMLYISIGDGRDGGGNAQNLGSWWGKILRINPAAAKGAPYGVPADNPFVGVSGAKPEIWAYGLRNPWRFSFDRQTGDLAIGDVGENKIDEIDFASNSSGLGRGANYGWNCFEGSQPYDAAPASCTTTPPANPVPPVLEQAHPSTGIDGWCTYSITGGYVVRDPTVPSLNGRYVYGDFCSGQVRSALLASPSATDDAATGINLPTTSLVSFGEDSSGRVYIATLSGPVYRIVETP
jgi:glucose/arabinose dehydrogenase